MTVANEHAMMLHWNLRGELAVIVAGVGIGTEGIAAIKATKVVQHTVIQDIAQNHASGGTSGSAQQRTNDGTADTAHGRTDGAGRHDERARR